MLATHSQGESILTTLVEQDQSKLRVATQAQSGHLPQQPVGQWEQVRRILTAATGFGSPRHDGKERFWERPLSEFLQLSIYGEPLIAPPGPDRGRQSNLVKALKGEAPFDGSDFVRMPLRRQPVALEHITFIQDWIDRDCPER